MSKTVESSTSPSSRASAIRLCSFSRVAASSRSRSASRIRSWKNVQRPDRESTHSSRRRSDSSRIGAADSLWPASSTACTMSNSLPSTAPTESARSTPSGSRSSRRTSTAADRRSVCTSASAASSTSQPSSLAVSAPHSTRPRSTAAPMNGLPSASRVTVATAFSGNGPAIDSASRVIALSESRPRCSDFAVAMLRSGASSATSSERNAATMPRCAGSSWSARERLHEQPDGERVGPLAVVEHQQHGVLGRRDRGQELAQRRQAALLTEGVRAERLQAGVVVGEVEQRAQRRQHVGGDLRALAEPLAQRRPQRSRVVAGGQVAGDALHQREGELDAVADPLAVQHGDAEADRLRGQLGEEPALAAARLGVEQHQAAAAVADLGQQRLEARQLGVAADERGVGEVLPVVDASDRRAAGRGRRPRSPPGARPGRRQRRCRLVAVDRVLAQQPLQDRVEDPGYVGPDVAHGRCGHRQVLTQQVAHARARGTAARRPGTRTARCRRRRGPTARRVSPTAGRPPRGRGSARCRPGPPGRTRRGARSSRSRSRSGSRHRPGRSPRSMTLAGLTSRCTMPASCATLSARAMSMPMRSTAPTDSRPDLSTRLERPARGRRGCTR